MTDRAKADSILAKIGSPSVPKGMKLVPIEPTGAMTEAIEFAIYRNADCSARDAERGAPHVYRALISSTPDPPVGDGWRHLGSIEDQDLPPWDGRNILVWGPHGHDHMVVFWDEDDAQWQTLDGPGYALSVFTHWMPTPSPPSSAEGNGRRP